MIKAAYLLACLLTVLYRQDAYTLSYLQSSDIGVLERIHAAHIGLRNTESLTLANKL